MRIYKTVAALIILGILCLSAIGAEKKKGSWWITEKHLQGNPLLKKGLVDVTLYDGWKGNAVDPSGVKDSTKALQQAINDARDMGYAAYFPSGTYKISDTISGMKRSLWREKLAEWITWDMQLSVVMVGSTRGPRPVLKLVDHAEGFGDPKHLKPAVILWQQLGGNPENKWNASGSPKPHQGPIDRTEPPTTCDIMHFRAQADMGQGMNQQLRGIDISIGEGNPGAVGLASCGAQGDSIEDCKVTATGAYAGFYGLPGPGAGAANIEVDGGCYGIVMPAQPESCTPTVAGAILLNQTVEAVHIFSEWTPMTMVGFKIVKESGPAVVMEHTYGEDSNLGGGALSLIDGSIEFTKPTAGNRVIDNTVGETFYARNLFITGAKEFIKSASQPSVPCPNNITRVKEYSFANPRTSVTLLDTNPGSREVVSVESTASIPDDLVSRNVWTRLPSFEDEGVKCVTDPDIGAKGDGKTDDAAALQSAIDKYEEVFLPNGIYAVGKSLVMHKNTKLFGVAKAHVKIQPLVTWLPTHETPVIITDDAADGTAYLADMNIGYNAMNLENDVFNCVTWRVGRASILKSIEAEQVNGYSKPHKLTGAHRLFVVTGNGGGRWYFNVQGAGYEHANAGPGFRLMSIVGTHEPLSFYNYNPEHPTSSPDADIIGASNLRIFGTKVECRHQDVFHITDCHNILLVGFGGHAQVSAGRSAYVIRNSTDVELVEAGCGSPNPEGNTITEISADGKTVSRSQKYLLALFKHGEVDDAPWGLK